MTKPLLMGIVNVTPDSFSDGGQFYDADAAIAHGIRLIEEGADMLDIGGESTKPGAVPVAVEDEIGRVVPVIAALSKTGKAISVDTRHAATMKAALEAGAGFINDITALQGAGSLEVAAAAGADVCLMHMLGTPQTMQDNPVYTDVVTEVYEFLKRRIGACVAAGIAREKIYVDVGIGFGKTLEHNLDLLRNLDEFHDLGVKILLGASRKSFISKITPAAPDQRLGGSLAAAFLGYQMGAQILRVHDVRETKQMIEVWDAIMPPLGG